MRCKNVVKKIDLMNVLKTVIEMLFFVNILWECLVVNVFNEDERDKFFVFCTGVLNAKQMSDYREELARYQNGSNDLAGDLIFEDDCFLRDIAKT